jgi:hypothetical protein
MFHKMVWGKKISVFKTLQVKTNNKLSSGVALYVHLILYSNEVHFNFHFVGDVQTFQILNGLRTCAMVILYIFRRFLERFLCM